MMKRLLMAFLCSAMILAGAFAVQAPVAYAQIDTGLNEVGGTIVLPDTDPRIIATRIINVALGLVGIILVVIIIYAGFLYMTSGGDASKTEKALHYIRNAVIGLIIILMSWGIARFVIERLLDATGGGGGSSQSFALVSITPSGPVTTRKVIIKIVFNRPVAEASAKVSGNIVLETTAGVPVATEVAVDGRIVRLTSALPCPSPNEDRRCLNEDTDYRVRIGSLLESTSGQRIACGGFSPPCEGTFRTGTTVDITPPRVTLTYPLNGQAVPADALVDVNAYVEDETGVAYVSFASGVQGGSSELIGEDAPGAGTNSPSRFDARTVWDTAGLAPGSRHTLEATAYDVDSGVASTGPVTVTIRAAQCFNGVRDGQETGLDCGGDPSSAAYCGACAGSSCTESGACASGVCAASQCVEQPIITSVTPVEGAVGSFVTIRGVNLGQDGQATFLGAAGGSGVVATAPQACVAANVDTWGPTQVVVQVPAGAQSGAIQVVNRASGLSDATNAPPNPFLDDFLVNDTQQPGVCAVIPESGVPGDRMRIVGYGFGNTVSSVLFGDRTLTSASWNDTEVAAVVPNVATGRYPVGIQVGNRVSNPVQFSVSSPDEEANKNPAEIVAMSPGEGPVGTYVTIAGRNFGRSIGQVFFRDIASGNEALADTNFPPLCSAGFWTDTSVVVKVPTAFTRGSTGALSPGSYAVRVAPSRAGAAASSEVNFAVNTAPVAPGICAVVPNVAPVGSTVTLYGERFTNGPGTVNFFQNRDGTVASWSSTQVVAAVPAGARPGPVTLTPAANGIVSNGVLLDVRSCTESPGICGAGDVCCADGTCRAAGSCSVAVDRAMFAWRTSTGVIPRAPRVVEECRPGEIPSPSPWTGRAGGDAVCVNATIAMRFTTLLEPTSVAPSQNAVRIRACTGTGDNPCEEGADVPLLSDSPVLQAANATQDSLMLTPRLALQPDTLYEVTLTTAVRGLGDAGTTMVENAAQCGAGNAYCFRFRTRADATPCSLGGVTVGPSPFTAYEQGPLKQPHYAVPLAANDACTVLQCSSYDWVWDTSDGRASVSNNRDLSRVPSVGACRQTVTAQAETGDSPVAIRASTLGVSGSADMYITFVPPRVERFGPDCDEACVNAAVWAVFNVELEESTVTADRVRLERCVNENCLEFIGSPFQLGAGDVRLGTVFGGTDPRLRQISIFPPSGVLLEGFFYKVTIQGGENGIRSKSGVPLAGLNTADGFSWTFRVRPGEAGLCQVERITVAPTQKYETHVGARQTFVASPVASPDACSESGQQLVPESLSWASSEPAVATLHDNGQVDTGPVPLGCSGRCTFAGAVGQAGRTAQCGNGRIETTNKAYCVNGLTVPWRTACELLAPGSKGGEECDDQNDDSNDGCSNTCLWNPMTSVADGGSCGNDIVDVGEECDHGRVCEGVLREGSTMSVGDACTTAATSAQCVADGGRCVVPLVRGCSPTCRNLGSAAGNSSCGNADLADGEDCDDGNLANGDGCSSSCLNEGSSRNVYAACGNGRFEPGEACEVGTGGVWPDGCDRVTCLRTGSAPCTALGQVLCCGNGNAANPREETEPGEDCDDGNRQSGDGCSATCRAEGSSLAYDVPSFCGNGVLEIGEQCESPGPTHAADATQPVPGGDGLVDTLQIAQIIGNGAADAAGRMSSTISASFPTQNKTGEAVYGLQCGFDDERSCSPTRDVVDPDQGLTSAGCCSLRPKLLPDVAPAPLATGVCRNVRIGGQFNVPMNATTLDANFLVAKRVLGEVCPEGLRDVSFQENSKSRNMFVRLWQILAAFFQPQPAYADRWCAGTLPGRLTTEDTPDATIFFFTLNSLLEPRTEYRVRFLGGASGVKSAQGVAALSDTGDSGNLSWKFTTGDTICTVNQVDVRDTNTRQPNLFTGPSETHAYVATALSLQNGRPVALSPVPGVYDWSWQDWTFSLPQLLEIRPALLTDDERTQSVTTRDLISKGVNGTGFLSARVAITADTVSAVPTVNRVIEGTAAITVNLCENPWPSRTEAPFRDAAESPSLAGTPFAFGPFFNFSVGYCRDAGATGPNEDLPGLIPSVNAPNAADAAQGILRQYLFTFREPSLQKDAIGIRIASNPNHLSPLDWYRSKGFTGSPQSLKIDGYDAIRDGRTVYVSAVSTDGPGSDMYSNIYLISYNDGAEPVTRQLADAFLESFTFNINVETDMSGACETAGGGLVTSDGGLPVTCVTDWECARYGAGNVCANFKAKVQRDLVRLGDFQKLSSALTSVRTAQGSYPALRTGSFLPGISTSRWPSWNSTFRTALGQGGDVLTADPVNRYSTCGRCTAGGTACVADADCAQGDVCAAQAGFDPVTCWNSQNEHYLCPNDEQGSHVYQYQSFGGTSYRLSATFEVPPPNALNVAEDWWKPAPPTTLASGATFAYTGMCTGSVSAATGSCGDGILNEGEMCELTGPTATQSASCTVGDETGKKQQRCVSCRFYADDTAQPGCVADVQCGNGRVDGDEVCDDGTENGRYGRCNLACNGYGAYCGDGQISPGEVCDKGSANRDYCPASSCTLSSACNVSCSGRPAFCGNGRVDVGEQCDGPMVTNKAYCVQGPRIGEVCSTNGDCGANGQCGGLLGVEVCPAGQVRTRTCAAACTYNAWTPCAREGRCGDGRVNGGEQCDDGNEVNEDGCISTGPNACKRNACGDGLLLRGVEECDLGTGNGQACQSAEYGSTCTSCSTSCKFQLTQGGYCGDDRRTPASGEQCDGTDVGNPRPSCQSLGFDYESAEQLSCTQTCQYTGCAKCGDVSGTGVVEGVLFDTLFQQPVSGAAPEGSSGAAPGRVTVSLYHGGSLQAKTSTDVNGYFRFIGLETRAECNQYELRIDATGDNPLTENFDESIRGGYLSVVIPSFAPSNAGLITAVKSALQGVEVTSPYNDNVLLAQINMIPRLAQDEYVVQLWWDPKFGGYEGMRSAFLDRPASDANGSAFYANQIDELHDLVVRVPDPYTPGNNVSSCTLSPSPDTYEGVGRNDPDLATDDEGIPGLFGVDGVDANLGMVSCTNKIRATASRTCTGGNVPASQEGKIGCFASVECRQRFGFNNQTTCTGNPEPSRAGDRDVLSGGTGAYLFCYHPEWPNGDSRRQDEACTNFILPPQSVFIRATGGQYDVMVSEYKLFETGSHRDKRNFIREWLRKRNARLLVYGREGLKDTITFQEVEEDAPNQNGWAEDDGDERLVCLENIESRLEADPSLKVRQLTSNLDAITVSPVWTPFSLDASTRSIVPWNEGYAGADYLYFADMPHGVERTCDGAPYNALSCWEERGDNPDTAAREGFLSCGGTQTGGDR